MLAKELHGLAQHQLLTRTGCQRCLFTVEYTLFTAYSRPLLPVVQAMSWISTCPQKMSVRWWMPT